VDYRTPNANSLTKFFQTPMLNQAPCRSGFNRDPVSPATHAVAAEAALKGDYVGGVKGCPAMKII